MPPVLRLAFETTLSATVNEALFLQLRTVPLSHRPTMPPETCFGRGVQIFDRYGSPVLAVFDHAVRYAGDHTEPAFGSYAAREGHRAILVDDDVLNRGAGTYMSEERRIAFPRLDKPAVTAEHTIERTCGGADRRPGLDFAHIDVREHVHEHAAFVFSGPVGDIFAGVPCLGEPS